jgi:acetylornithine deacetylase
MRIGLYPGMDLADARRQVEQCVAEAASKDPFLGNSLPEIVYHGFQAEGYVLPEGTVAEALLAHCHQAVSGKALEKRAGTGTTDARFFGLYAGIPAMVYGPISNDIHAYDERVDLDSLRRVTQTIALFIADWCGVAAA